MDPSWNRCNRTFREEDVSQTLLLEAEERSSCSNVLYYAATYHWDITIFCLIYYQLHFVHCIVLFSVFHVIK